MAIPKKEEIKEQRIFEKVNSLLETTYQELGKEVSHHEENLLEFKKMMWENASSFDEGEEKQAMLATDQEVRKQKEKEAYFQKLTLMRKKPYFASIVFEDEEKKLYNIYLSISYLKDQKYNNILYDWRSPICSLFYDYETGPCSYMAPMGEVKGELKRKRQYKIEEGKLIGIFDNSLNINDEVLQQVLVEESTDKMKEVVNTIQKEQNQVIRNLENNHIIVQGIAGSGKTTVALHRIAFLLYQLKNLRSDDIIIFSPNQIFTDYISEVLPSLGESNTLQTTFSDYLTFLLKEYKEIETFPSFIARYYSGKEMDEELVEYKQSDHIIDDMDAYLDSILEEAHFTTSIRVEKYHADVGELNDLLQSRFEKFPLMNRVEEIAKKLSYQNYKGTMKKYSTYLKLLYESASFERDYRKIYANFFQSEYTRIYQDEDSMKKLISSKMLSYEDALCMAYIKGRLEGFYYEGNIKQVVVDEAQDYNRLQYIILENIFQKADFTILGDIHQNMNPYYHYDSLEELKHIFRKNTCYIELNKTYRSSKEIIEYTNKILHLKHVNAIRDEVGKPVVIRKNIKQVKEQLLKDIQTLKQEHSSLAIITKDVKTGEFLYELLKEDIPISLLEESSKVIQKDLVILPAYLAKGLEFDSVIVYNDRENSYKNKERNLLYVACTRAGQELYIYN